MGRTYEQVLRQLCLRRGAVKASGRRTAVCIMQTFNCADFPSHVQEVKHLQLKNATEYATALQVIPRYDSKNGPFKGALMGEVSVGIISSLWLWGDWLAA